MIYTWFAYVITQMLNVECLLTWIDEPVSMVFKWKLTEQISFLETSY